MALDTYSFSSTAEGTEDRFSLEEELRIQVFKIEILFDIRRDMPTLSGKPLHVPLARPLDVLDGNFESLKIESRNGIEAHIE